LRTFLAASFSAQGYSRVRPVALQQQNAIQQDWNVDRLLHLYVCNQATARSAFRDE
jgi:hypothetical protein